MSYILESDLEATELIYGNPNELSVEITATAKELAMIRKSQHSGRSHDITIFITKDDKYLFIAKHFYPKGLFRAPSGAAKPGETIAEGAMREAYEETGTKIELKKYILRIQAKFVNGSDSINWTTHVFTARWVSGEPKPIDIDEIRKARFVTRDEFDKFNKIMLNVNSGGFRYRAFLNNNFVKLMDNNSSTASEINEI